VRQHVSYIFDKAGPVRLHRMQVVFYPDQKLYTFINKFITNSLYTFTTFFPRYKGTIVVATNQKVIEQAVSEQGMSLDDFPTSMGGKYT
jgi:hypothetical protein